LKVQSLHIYPVKSTRGLDIRYAEVRARGLRGDRRWMIVDEHGNFITQRDKAKLAQVKIKMAGDGLKLTIPNQAPIIVAMPDGIERMQTKVWKSKVNAAKSNGEADQALSTFLNKPVALVNMDDDAERFSSEKYAEPGTPVSFADGYPLLITNSASLNALNKHIVAASEDAVPMKRFRPNIVIEGDEAWTEDRWQQIKIGDVVLDLVKPCTRCVTTTIDQVTGVKQSKEPLRTLRARRLSKDPDMPGVLFGWNAVPRTLGRIGVGDKVSI